MTGKSNISGAAAAVGVGLTDFVDDHRRIRAGEVPTDGYGYAALAFRRALDDAGLAASDIDGLVVGPTTAGERMAEVLSLDVRWGTQADAMTAVHQAVTAINAGLCEVVACIYGNNQRTANVAYGGDGAAGGEAFLAYVYHAPWGFTSQGALYAMHMRRWMWETGFTEKDLGEVAVAQRLHASLNPEALMRKRITIDDYIQAPYITEPLRLLDYCLINDGGVAFIIMEAKRAKRLLGDRAVPISGIGRFDLNAGATSLEPRLTEFYRPAQRRAAADSFAMAGVGPEDMDGMLVYDSFSPHIPLALEGYGYCEIGGAAKFIRDRGISLERGLPVNTHGGHMSESYMQGWSHQVEAIRQVRGECGDRQISDCRFIHYNSDVAGKAMSIIYGS